VQFLCLPVTTVSTRAALRSAAREDLVVPRIPDDVLATGHFASPVPQHRTACRQTFELLLLWQLSRIYSRLTMSLSCQTWYSTCVNHIEVKFWNIFRGLFFQNSKQRVVFWCPLCGWCNTLDWFLGRHVPSDRAHAKALSQCLACLCDFCCSQHFAVIFPRSWPVFPHVWTRMQCLECYSTAFAWL